MVGTTPVGDYFGDPDHKRSYDEVLLKRALSPWGRVRSASLLSSPFRNLIPVIRQQAPASSSSRLRR